MNSAADLEELIKCSVCLEIFREPKLLPCNHTYCKNCLYKLLVVEWSQIKCPLCNKKFIVKQPNSGFKTDFKTNQLLDYYFSRKNEQTDFVLPSAPPIPLNYDFTSVNEPMIKNNKSSAENESGEKFQDLKYKRRKLYKYLLIGLLFGIILGLILFVIIHFSTKKVCTSHEYKENEECKPKKQFLEKCSISNECSDTQSLLCINNTCSCHDAFTYFNFENKKCQHKKREYEQCKFSNECLEPMVCKEQKCTCNSNEYFDEIEMKCVNKTLFNSECMSNKTCHDELGLSCQNRLCQCDMTKKFWSNEYKKCVDKYFYGVIGCKVNNQCSSNLVCNLVESNCSCPLKSQLNMCDCERTDENYLYWNGNKCVPAGLNWSRCKHDYECRPPFVCLDSLSKCSKSGFLKFFFKSNHSNFLTNSGIIQLFCLVAFFIFLN